MQSLARNLPASAFRISRLKSALPLPNLSVSLRLSACSSKSAVWQRNARFLSSTSVQRQEEHPVFDQINTVVTKHEARSPTPKTLEERWIVQSKEALRALQNKPPADAYSGRTVENPNERVFARSLQQLEGILFRNKVRQQLRLTERHEKKGVKRRRLSSERWRKRFANEVRKKVQLVMKIRDRGA